MTLKMGPLMHTIFEESSTRGKISAKSIMPVINRGLNQPRDPLQNHQLTSGMVQFGGIETQGLRTLSNQQAKGTYVDVRSAKSCYVEKATGVVTGTNNKVNSTERGLISRL